MDSLLVKSNFDMMVTYRGIIAGFKIGDNLLLGINNREAKNKIISGVKAHKLVGYGKGVELNNKKILEQFPCYEERFSKKSPFSAYAYFRQGEFQGLVVLQPPEGGVTEMDIYMRRYEDEKPLYSDFFRLFFNGLIPFVKKASTKKENLRGVVINLNIGSGVEKAYLKDLGFRPESPMKPNTLIRHLGPV